MRMTLTCAATIFVAVTPSVTHRPSMAPAGLPRRPLTAFFGVSAAVTSYFSCEVVHTPLFRAILMPAGSATAIGAALFATASQTGFRWKDPFQGGTKYVTMQMFGWFILGTSFCISVVTGLHTLRTDAIGAGVAGVFLAACTLFGDAVILVSLHYFDDELNALPAAPFRRRLRFRLSAFLCGLVAFCLFVAADVYRQADCAPRLLTLACAAMALSALYTHCVSSRDVPGYKLFAPFEGGNEFVLLQAIAWMLLSAVRAPPSRPLASLAAATPCAHAHRTARAPRHRRCSTLPSLSSRPRPRPSAYPILRTH